MRLTSQLAVIALLGAAGFGGWYAYKEGRLASVPVVGSYLPAPPAQATGPSGGGGRRNEAVASVDVDIVKTGRIVETREAVGTVRAFESIIVTAKVAGMIDKIAFEEGQKVKAGDIIVSLDALERRAEIQQRAAEINRATAMRNEVATRLDRAQALRRTGSGTEAQVEDLSAQVKTLESAIASAEAQLKAADARLEDIVVRAPFAGRVGTRAVSLGAYLSPGTKITTLDDLSKVRLDFSVPENLLARLKSGQVVNAISAAFRDRVFKGKVSIVDTRVDPVTRSVRLTAEFDNQDEALKPGMFLTVSLEVTTKDDAVVVPEEAVVSEGLRHLVYPVKDNKVERRVIRIGQRQGGKVEVLDGLKAGETIVVLGVQRVAPGATVNARPAGTPPVPAARQEPSLQSPGAATTRGALNAVSSAKAAER
jgi:membrane fusion protein (multidrug efflux system)